MTIRWPLFVGFLGASAAFRLPPASLQTLSRSGKRSGAHSIDRERIGQGLALASSEGENDNAAAGAAAAAQESAATRREFAQQALAGVLGGWAWAAAIGSVGAEEGEAAGNAAAVESAAAPAPAPAVKPPAAGGGTAFDFDVPYNGKKYPMSKFLGKATVVVNCKIDDPISLQQMPALVQMAARYRDKGLHVILVPTDQGYFEADEDRVVKIKIYQQYGFGQFPTSVVLDKMDIVGNTAHPLAKYLCRSLKNPNGIGRITLDYEKFLLDAAGRPVRRYPRKFSAGEFERDVQALLAGQSLPAPTPEYEEAWVSANREAEKSEYAFKLGLNYYNNL